MKTFFTVLAAAILTVGVWAQSPMKMSYQAVVRNSSGQLVINQVIGMQVSIIQGSADGTAVYSETQFTTTNDIGLVSIEIGGGVGFDAIDWANGSYFIKTETDPDGGTNYTITNTSQLLSVPYALHARTAEALSGEITETDPVFGASPAKTISGSDIANWNSKQNKLTAGNGITINGDTISATGLLPNGKLHGEMLYWNDTTWISVTPGTNGSTLSLCNNVPTWGRCVPMLTTASVSDITLTSAIVGGTITSDRGFPVTARGVCWSTSSNPTADGNHTSDGGNTGIFSSSLTGLTPNTTYYVRAFAVNSEGTAYGNEVSFTTSPINEPTVCYSKPDGVIDCWSYKDYIIPVGYKIDSVYMDASRPGYPQEEYDLIIGYCPGKTSYDPSVALFPLDYTVTTSPMYNTWLNLTNHSIESSGVVRVTLPTCNGAVWNALCFAISPLNHSTVCFSAPDGIGSLNWSYKDYIIPDGYKIDSVFMDATRPGYPVYQYDLNLAYCPGTTTYNFSVAIFPLDYGKIASSMYNTWIDLTNLSIKAAGMVRVKLPTGGDAVWNNLCLAISKTNVSIPQVTTTAITNISYTSASIGGEATSDGGASIGWRGVCWNTSPTPTINDNSVSVSIRTEAFTCVLTGLYPGILYYARAFATNSEGIGYGNEVSFTTKSAGYTIGQAFGGGMIFYIDSTGQHGLIADTTHPIPYVEWGCDSIFIDTRQEIGTGQANTLAIVNGCSQPGIAARLCYDLVLNGFDDWFLPSLDEFTEYCKATTVINGYGGSSHWTSTADDVLWAICHFCGGQDEIIGISTTFKENAQAVRAF